MSSTPENLNPEAPSHQEAKPYARGLHELSSECYTLFPEGGDIVSFLTPIIERAKANADRIRKGMPWEELQKDALCVVGIPGSGKTTTLLRFYQVLLDAGVDPELIYTGSWDSSQGGAEHKGRIAQVSYPDTLMQKGNVNSFERFMASTGWAIALDEAAPVLSDTLDGRDAGGTALIQSVAASRRLGRNIEFSGLIKSPEARMDFFIASRESGAFYNQFLQYREKAWMYAVDLHDAGKIQLPDFIYTLLATGKGFEKFPEEYAVFAEEYGNLKMSKDERAGALPAEEFIELRRIIYQHEGMTFNARTIASAYLEEYFLVAHANIHKKNIFGALHVPPYENLEGKDYDGSDYLNDYDAGKLAPPDME